MINNKPRTASTAGAEPSSIPPLLVSSIPNNGTDNVLEQYQLSPNGVEERYRQWLVENGSKSRRESTLVTSWSD